MKRLITFLNRKIGFISEKQRLKMDIVTKINSMNISIYYRTDKGKLEFTNLVWGKYDG